MPHEEIFQILQDLIAEQFAKDPNTVMMQTSFDTDVGADSVDLMELVMAMEEEFEIGETQEEELSELKTVGDAVNYIADKLNR